MNSFPYPSMRDRFDLRFYFVVGPDDCGNRPILDVVAKALDGGASFIQLRAKTQDVAEIVSLANDIAEEIAGHHVEHSVAFVVDDRVDAALEARAKGIKVDGVHIGQDDLDPVVARKLLGPDAIIGLSAKTVDEVREANHLPEGTIDYIGAGPLHMTATKPESMIVDENGDITTLNVSSIDEMRTMSKYPLIVGGGVKADDIPMLAKTKADGWFVVSAIAGATDPEQATRRLVDDWTAIRGDEKPRYTGRKPAATKLPAVLTIATTDSSGGAGIPADLNYEGYPKSVCTSVNEQVCHGIPSDKIILKEGDIVNVDVSTIYNGYYSDSSRMFCIGQVSEEAEKLVRVAKECVELGLKEVKPWGFLGDIAQVISDHAHQNGYTIVREIGGHGVGLQFHEDPWVGYVGKRGTDMLLAPGMVFTIEPMVNQGSYHVKMDSSAATEVERDWIVLTSDGKLSAQWEITVAVTEDGAEVLTY